MLCPSLKALLWLLILTGEWCGWGGVCRIGPCLGMLPRDAPSFGVMGRRWLWHGEARGCSACAP